MERRTTAVCGPTLSPNGKRQDLWKKSEEGFLFERNGRLDVGYDDDGDEV